MPDIAWSLSRVSRYTGHTLGRFPYPVAQHSVYVSEMVPEEDALWGLFHDGSEAYLVDLPSPIKRMPQFHFYRVLERRVQKKICKALGLSWPEPPSVHEADRRMVSTEKRDLMVRTGLGSRGWTLPRHYAPYDFSIEPWPPWVAYRRFLLRYKELAR